MPLPFSALVSPVFYMLAIIDTSSPWTAVSMWHLAPLRHQVSLKKRKKQKRRDQKKDMCDEKNKQGIYTESPVTKNPWQICLLRGTPAKDKSAARVCHARPSIAKVLPESANLYPQHAYLCLQFIIIFLITSNLFPWDDKNLSWLSLDLAAEWSLASCS
jgi:hypothetical protein